MVDDEGVTPTGGLESPSSLLLVVVTGVPGAGKTTLGSALALALGARFLSLDAIKESLYAGEERTQAPAELRLNAERELGVQLAAADGPAVVDIWIAPDRDTERVTTLLQQQDRDVVELLCRVPADTAVARYVGRRRGWPHRAPDEPTLQRIREASDAIEPLGIGTCIEVDTSRPVDIDKVLDGLRP